MRKPSRNVCDVTLPGHKEAESECLLLSHGDVPLPGHEEVESKNLLLGLGDASYSAMKKPSWKVFYSAVAIPSTRSRRRPLLVHEEAESESLLLDHDDAFY